MKPNIHIDMRSARRRLNFELLEHFEALMRERHVSRAAVSMGIGQPAMSAALARLRDIFGDPLLVRTGQGMVTTERAHEIAVLVREMFDLAERSLSPSASVFDPGKAQAVVTIAASEGIAWLVVPSLMRFLRCHAPGVQIRVQPSDNRRIREYLEESRSDIALSFVQSPPPNLRSSPLYPQRVCSIVSRDHPRIREQLSIEDFVAFPHVSWGTDAIPFPAIEIMVDEAVQAMGYQRKIGLRVPSLLLTPSAVASTDMIATLPERIARRQQDVLPIRIFVPPMELAPTDIRMFWHERTHRDPLMVWLRQILREEAKKLGD